MDKDEKKKFIEKQVTSLSRIHELHKQIKDINNSLEQLYPITIVAENIFFVFDLDVASGKYELKLEHKAPMEMPKRVLSAFPLDFYNMKPSAIVTEDVFESIEGYIFIFHEFVHCFQWESCEMELRETLEIAIKAKEENNFMWEVTYPFPYRNPVFIEKVMELDNFFKLRNYNGVLNCYKEIKLNINKIDFEYMIWQEWKEGFARYIENLIRDRLSFNRNTNILQIPFDRVCFYEIGSKYIELLANVFLGLEGNLKNLYYKMFGLD